jgi:hypothetical protein
MPGQENRDDRVVFDAVQLFIGDEADHRLGELGELPIGLDLLGEGGLKQSLALDVTQHLSVSSSGTIPSDFIVLHPLSGGDQTGIAHALVTFGLEPLRAFGQHALHASVPWAARRLVVALQNFFQSICLLSGLFEMRLEGGSELRARGGFDHLWQGIENLLLGAVEGLELVHVKIFEGLKFHLGWRRLVVEDCARCRRVLLPSQKSSDAAGSIYQAVPIANAMASAFLFA